MIEISHQQIRAYLEGKCEAKELARLQSLRRKDRIAELLMELMDRLRRHSNRIIPSQVGQFQAEIGMDAALESLLAGTMRAQEAQHVLEALIHSPSYYERFLLKTARIANATKGQADPDLHKIHVREDGEILALIKSASATPRKKEKAGFAKYVSGALQDFWAKLRGTSAARPVIARWPAAAFAIVVAIVSLSIWRLSNRAEHHFTYYLFPDRVPYEYDGLAWRGASDSSDDPRLQAMKRQFKFAISDYTARRYQEAISQFQELRSEIASLQTPTADSTTLAFIRDYYFYFGLAHFGYSNDPGLNQPVKTHQLGLAIHLLSQAERIANHIDPQGTEREDYFLGLAFKFSARTDSALFHLRAIPPESVFYQDSVALINQLAAH